MNLKAVVIGTIALTVIVSTCLVSMQAARPVSAQAAGNDVNLPGGSYEVDTPGGKVHLGSLDGDVKDMVNGFVDTNGGLTFYQRQAVVAYFAPRGWWYYIKKP